MNNVPSAMAGDAFAMIDHARAEAPPGDRAAFDTTLALAAESAVVESEAAELEDDDTELPEEPPTSPGAAVVLPPSFVDALAVAQIGSEPAPVADAGLTGVEPAGAEAPPIGSLAGDDGAVVAERGATYSSAPMPDAEDRHALPRADEVEAHEPNAGTVDRPQARADGAPAEVPGTSAAPANAPPSTSAAASTSAVEALWKRPGATVRAEAAVARAPAVSALRDVPGRAGLEDVRVQQTVPVDAPRPAAGGAGVAPVSLRDAVAQSAISGRHPHTPLAGRAVSGAAQPAPGARASKRALPAEPFGTAAREATAALDARSVAETAATTVGAPAEGVKPMAVVTVPTAAASSGRASVRDVDGDIRAAEAVGHRRVLGGEARGQIDVPELGKVEVRAFANAASVDVHVHAEEAPTKQVIVAHAPDLAAHVQREVPDARIHFDSPSAQGHPGAGAPAQQGLASDHRGHRRELADEREASGARDGIAHVNQPSVQRHRARVRIVL